MAAYICLNYDAYPNLLWDHLLEDLGVVRCTWQQQHKDYEVELIMQTLQALCDFKILGTISTGVASLPIWSNSATYKSVTKIYDMISQKAIHKALENGD